MTLYRIVDFFDLLQTLQLKKLRVPSAARFPDRNELIGSFISTMMHPWFTPLTQVGVAKRLSEQRLILESCFVSCWTGTRDSIAMWEIYSPTKTGAQIEVSEESLSEAFKNHWTASSFAAAQQAAPDDDRTFFYPTTVNDCIYTDLRAELETMREMTQSASARAVAAYRESGEAAHKAVLEEQRAAAEKYIPRSLFLKDQAFKHEEERRFVLHAIRRNSRPIAECSRDRGFVLFDTHLRPAEVRDTGGQIFIDFPPAAIQRVWLDGRAPAWLIDAQRRLLDGFGVHASQSPAYGSLLDMHPTEKWWD